MLNGTARRLTIQARLRSAVCEIIEEAEKQEWPMVETFDNLLEALDMEVHHRRFDLGNIVEQHGCCRQNKKPRGG